MSLLLLALAAVSLLLLLWQWAAAWRFPLHLRFPAADTPPFSIFKPLKGADRFTARALESWFDQKYPAPFELLLGVTSLDDPACAIVRDLVEKHPAVPARLVHCEPLLGPNAKVSTLCHLLPLARHQHLLISDDDVLAPPDFLEQCAAAFTREQAALVTAFYQLPPGASLGSRWESFAVNADFWSQVLQGNSLHQMDFALGAAIALTKNELAAIGGFQALLQCLADDFQLGHRVSRRGGKIAIVPAVVSCLSEEGGFREAWNHQLRWARTIRFCRPLPYFLSILSNPTVWPLLYLAFERSVTALALFGVALLCRGIAGWALYRRMTGNAPRGVILMGPIKDLLQAAIWAAAFLGRTVLWRGQKFRIRAGGCMEPIPKPASNSGPRPAPATE